MRHHLALFAILSALLLAAPAQAVDPECIDPVGTETIVWEADEVPLLRICTPADPADRALSHVVPFLAHSGDPLDADAPGRVDVCAVLGLDVCRVTGQQELVEIDLSGLVEPGTEGVMAVYIRLADEAGGGTSAVRRATFRRGLPTLSSPVILP